MCEVISWVVFHYGQLFAPLLRVNGQLKKVQKNIMAKASYERCFVGEDVTDMNNRRKALQTAVSRSRDGSHTEIACTVDSVTIV